MVWRKTLLWSAALCTQANILSRDYAGVCSYPETSLDLTVAAGPLPEAGDAQQDKALKKPDCRFNEKSH